MALMPPGKPPDLMIHNTGHVFISQTSGNPTVQ
jgi:hypothetical protein